MSLEIEAQTYDRERARLLQHEGKFVLVHGEEIAGIFGAYEDALQAGYEKYGLRPFLVKRIEAVEQVQFFARELKPCPT